MMISKKLEVSFIVFGVLFGFAFSAVLLNGCGKFDPETTRIIDAQGKQIYEPPNPPKETYQIPPTGNTNLDYILATAAAAIYGAMGYGIRRVKKNGQKENSLLDKRIVALEHLAAIETPDQAELRQSIIMEYLEDCKSAGYQIKKVSMPPAPQPSGPDFPRQTDEPPNMN